MALPRANLKRALAWRDAERLPWVPHERVWGPVSAADAIAVGCVRAAASVVIRPKLSPHALAAAVRCVPTEVLPRADDTPATLAARLGLSPSCTVLTCAARVRSYSKSLELSCP